MVRAGVCEGRTRKPSLPDLTCAAGIRFSAGSCGSGKLLGPVHRLGRVVITSGDRLWQLCANRLLMPIPVDLPQAMLCRFLEDKSGSAQPCRPALLGGLGA